MCATACRNQWQIDAQQFQAFMNQDQYQVAEFLHECAQHRWAAAGGSTAMRRWWGWMGASLMLQILLRMRPAWIDNDVTSNTRSRLLGGGRGGGGSFAWACLQQQANGCHFHWDREPLEQALPHWQ